MNKSLRLVLGILLLPLRKFFALGIGGQVFLAAIIAAAFGVSLRYVNIGIVPLDFKILGDIFLNLVKMTIVPLIFFAISSAILSMKDLTALGSAAKKGIGLFAITNILGVITGLVVAIIIRPGIVSGFNPDSLSINSSTKNLLASASANVSIGDKILHMVPDNAFQAMCSADLLQVMFFAIIFAVAVSIGREKVGESFIAGIENMAKVMYAMIKIVMKFAPFGIFGLVVWIAGSQNASTISVLFKLLFTAVSAIIFMVFVLYPAMLWARHRVNPFVFIRKMIPVQIFALATGSSAATLPMNMKNVYENLGGTKSSAELLMPIGTSIDMNATACCLALYTVFVAQLFGIPLTPSSYFTIGVVCFLSSLGSPPVPGGAVIILSGVLTTLNYPIEAVSLIFAIDKIIGPIRTLGNVTGEAFSPLYIDLLTGKCDKKMYYSKNIT